MCRLLLATHSKRRQTDLICLFKRRKRSEFSEKLKDENMIMETLTISRVLEETLCKEFYKGQDVVKQLKTIGRQDIARIGFKSKSVMFSVLQVLVTLFS